MNLLTILIDQLRFDALSCMGCKAIKTPRLDELAQSGALITQAVCAYPLCGPSRASLLTGTYPWRHGFFGNADIRKDGLSPECKTVDEILAENGYYTCYFGKWHTGRAHRDCYAGGLPHYLTAYKQHIDDKYGAPTLQQGMKKDRHTALPYHPDLIDDLMQAAEERGDYMPHHHEAGVWPFPCEDSLTAWTASQLIHFLESYEGMEPFAATCSILHPHAPLIACEPYASLFKGDALPMPFNVEDDLDYSVVNPVPNVLHTTPEQLGRYMELYYGLVREVDDWIGRILDTLEAKGLRENTLIVFTADHGELMGSHYTFSKLLLFEESMRVPLVISCPGIIPAGQKLRLHASGVDIAPTLLDFAGIAIPDFMQGDSLKKTLCGQPDDRPAHSVCTVKKQYCIREADWKLILNPFEDCKIKQRAMLYDLASDPGEQHNLLSARHKTATNIAKAEELRKLLLERLETLGVARQALEPYRTYQFE